MKWQWVLNEFYITKQTKPQNHFLSITNIYRVPIPSDILSPSRPHLLFLLKYCHSLITKHSNIWRPMGAFLSQSATYRLCTLCNLGSWAVTTFILHGLRPWQLLSLGALMSHLSLSGGFLVRYCLLVGSWKNRVLLPAKERSCGRRVYELSRWDQTRSRQGTRLSQVQGAAHSLGISSCFR